MKRDDVSTLEAHLGYWLRFVSNHVSQAFAEKLAARGVNTAEWVVMRALYDASSAPSALAERIGMTRGAISKLADRLIGKAFVMRGEGGADRRWQTLTLTAQGRKLVPQLAALADQNDAEFFGHLNAIERASLEASLRGIVRSRGFTSIPTE